MTTARSLPYILLWTSIGLLVTIGANFIDVYTIAWPWQWGKSGVSSYSLFITAQIGAVLLIGCLGGKYAGIFSQIGYLLLGLVGFQIFRHGGGLNYWHQPSFGYLLGFTPAGWLCGHLAFLRLPRLERLVLSCIAGLITIHAIGIVYLILLQLTNASNRVNFNWIDEIWYYSVNPVPSQLILVCAVSLVAACLRKLLLY
jgi:biotin transport system substrate-specific component